MRRWTTRNWRWGVDNTFSYLSDLPNIKSSLIDVIYSDPALLKMLVACGLRVGRWISSLPRVRMFGMHRRGGPSCEISQWDNVHIRLGSSCQSALHISHFRPSTLVVQTRCTLKKQREIAQYFSPLLGMEWSHVQCHRYVLVGVYIVGV